MQADKNVHQCPFAILITATMVFPLLPAIGFVSLTHKETQASYITRNYITDHSECNHNN